MKFESVLRQFLFWIIVLSLNLSSTTILTAQDNPNRLGQNGWCCKDGKVYESTEEGCAENGGFFFFQKKQAEQYCKDNFEQIAKKKSPTNKTQIQEDKGWCCKDGEVYKSTEEECANAGGFFFFEKKQANKYCKENFEQTERPNPSDIEPQFKAEQGWCCANGEVFPITIEECERQGGMFFLSEEEAWDYCKTEFNGKEDVDGWCCRDGEVYPTTMMECEIDNGMFFYSEEEARGYCENEHPPEGGWCCIENEITPMTAHECEINDGMFFPTEEEAMENCIREEIQPQDGWCCVEGEVHPMNIADCERQNGMFFLTEEEAMDHCRREDVRPIDGWCCHDGEVHPIPVEECEKIGGVYFPTEEEAMHHCMQAEPRDERGWCCLEGEVYEATADECHPNGGILFPTREEAVEHCKGISRRGWDSVWCCVDGQVIQLLENQCRDRGGYCAQKKLEAEEYCAYLRQQNTNPNEETMDTDKTPDRVFKLKNKPIVKEYFAIEDATVDEAFPEIAMGYDPELKVSWSDKVGNLTQRTLLRFPDIDLPGNAFILRAVLDVIPINVSGDGIALVTEVWSEDNVTWNTQPEYNRPFIGKRADDESIWDVTPIVSGWYNNVYENYGFVITEEAGTVSKSIYKSKESGSPAKLIVEYIIDDCDCDPTPPETIRPLEFTIDRSLQPEEDFIAPIIVNGESIDRPVAVMQYENLSPMKFVEDEIIFKSQQQGDVDEFIAKYNGRILRYPGIPDPPAGLDLQTRDVDPGSNYLIKVDPAKMDLNTINSDAESLGLSGRHKFSSNDARKLFAIIFREQTEDNQVSINMVGEFVQHFPKTTITEQTNGPLFEDPMNQGINYPAISDTTTQNTGVNRAWQYMSFSTRQNDVWAAVIDGGFPINNSGKATNDMANNTYLDLPSKYAQYDFNDDDYIAEGDALMGCGGGSCPTHGTGTSAAVSAVQDNSYGIAGVGSPVAKPMLFKIGGSIDQAERAIRTAVAWGAEVLNMSIIFDCDYWCRAFGWSSGYSDFKDAMSLADANGLFIAAAAGNYDEDLSDHHYIPATLKWTTLCVGALGDNSRAKASYSNYGTWSASPFGTGGVNIWAPGTVRVGPDAYESTNHDVSGTSIASPFVAGAAALLIGVNPTLTNHQIRSIFHSTLNAPLYSTVQPGSINVLRAVQNAGKPLNDKYGSHSNTTTAVQFPDAGLTNMTITPGETDYFYYRSKDILDNVEITVTYVEQLGDLIIGSPDPTSSKTKNSGTQTTTRTITSKKLLCNGDDFYFYIKGANAAVGNAYNLSVSTTQALSFKQDKYEYNDVKAAAKKIPVSKPTSLDAMTGLCPSCGGGLTLHNVYDVDFFTFTVNASDFSTENPDLKVSLCANVSLTMKVYVDGNLVSTQTGSSIIYKNQTGKGGVFVLEISGKTVNSYDIRARICNLFREEQAPKWEAWLKEATMPQPPKLIPGLDTIIRDLPMMVQNYVWNETGLFEIEEGNLMQLENTYMRKNIDMNGSRSIYVIGAAEAQTLNLDIRVHRTDSSGQDDIQDGVYAGLWNSKGDNLWRGDALTEDTGASIELEPDNTYFLIINGTDGTHSNIGIELDK